MEHQEMDGDKLDAILMRHKRWLERRKEWYVWKGKRADLQGANLKEANLQGADLRRHPEGPALALLRIAARHPRVLKENLTGTAPKE